MASSPTAIPLPAPRLAGPLSVEAALAARRSVRTAAQEPLSLADLGQILWSAQGVTAQARGRKTAPSAGATYPLEVFAVVADVEGLQPGVYQYVQEGHSLWHRKAGDLREDLCEHALGQEWVLYAPVVLVVAAVYERTTARYGDRGIRYVHMEVGHVGQNVHLQVESLNLGTVVIGAFRDEDVKKLLEIEEEPLYLLPVYHKE